MAGWSSRRGSAAVKRPGIHAWHRVSQEKTKKKTRK